MDVETWRYLWILPLLFASGFGDTPANCSYEDIRGSWTFLEGERSSGSDLNCVKFTGPIFYRQTLELRFPNVAVDKYGKTGYWTMIYNQGFEVEVNYRKYFAFSMFEVDGSGTVVTSYCGTVSPGWSHDIMGNNWACYVAHKNTEVEPTVHHERKSMLSSKRMREISALVREINKSQNSWRAAEYPELNHLTFEERVRRSGGLSSRVHRSPPPAPVSPYHEKMRALLPKEFDWRNVSGQNFVSPVRDQGRCGSCYAFSALAMLESRLRVQTNNEVQVSFSPQDVLSCSNYSQGCDGGFPYLIMKYVQDFGAVPEECFPYKAKDLPCPEEKCKRYYNAEYSYVGGSFGECNEPLMMRELVENGPLTVGFEVYPDFPYYKNGIYHHTETRSHFNPFVLVNHGVLLVGYGIDKETGEKYWIAKNSWGKEWGKDGYFKIRRGTNECNIESMAVSAIPIP